MYLIGNSEFIDHTIQALKVNLLGILLYYNFMVLHLPKREVTIKLNS